MKCTGLLMIVSGLPLIVAVTVTVNGEPAVALEGVVNCRIAWGLAQLLDSSHIAILMARKVIVTWSLVGREFQRRSGLGTMTGMLASEVCSVQAALMPREKGDNRDFNRPVLYSDR